MYHAKEFESSDQSIDLVIGEAHQAIVARFDFLHRIAIVVFDKTSGQLKPYCISDLQKDTVAPQGVSIEGFPALQKLLQQKEPAQITALSPVGVHPDSEVTKLSHDGHPGCYAYPIFFRSQIVGFVFFNGQGPTTISKPLGDCLTSFAHLLATQFVRELELVHNLRANIRSYQFVTFQRDPETADHLERMAHYCRLIASEVAPIYQLSDSFVQRLFWFAPLHDIGKILIPDSVLFKKGRLTREEFDIIQSHCTLGVTIIDEMCASHGYQHVQHIDMLRNVALMHHEYLDGSGYPNQLQGEEIPIEGRIAAVADIFDALTTERVYKSGWTNEQAADYLMRLRERQLDGACVDALLHNLNQVEAIQKFFTEEDIHSETQAGVLNLLVS